MNGILRSVGLLCLALQAPFVFFRERWGWRGRMVVPGEVVELKGAIEALFPGPVGHSVKAYEEFVPEVIDPAVRPGFAWPGDSEGVWAGRRVTRVVHSVYACGYEVVSGRDLDKERRCVEFLYQTVLDLSLAPENQGALLVWRKEPEARVDGDAPWLQDLECFSGHKQYWVLRMRFGLRPTGWRERLGISTITARGLCLEGAFPRIIA